MRKCLLLLLVLISVSGFSQLSESFRELKIFSKQKEALHGDTSIYLSNYYQNNLNYFYPLYKAFYNEEKLFKKDSAAYIDDLKQVLSLTGDYASVIALEKIYQGKPPLLSKSDLDTLTAVTGSFEYADARKYILAQAKNNRVVMINEAHDKPLHRAFTASLLEDLYKQGFRYLAMEMLSNNKQKPITKVDAYTGYYATEPVAGELIRKALELGYTLVAYEDTAATHTVNQREYAQAENLATFLRTHDSTGKMLVHAGYGHIQKSSESSFIPMAAYFKIITGITPLSVDQTTMTENSMNSFMSFVNTAWLQKHPVNAPAVALNNGKPFDLYGSPLYDIYITHPPTKYQNARPVWTSINGLKKETAVPAAFRSAFFLQAYYADEYTPATIAKCVPADQTYQSAANGIYYLYLRKGKYRLVFRDKAYEILGSKEIEVP